MMQEQGSWWQGPFDPSNGPRPLSDIMLFRSEAQLPACWELDLLIGASPCLLPIERMIWL